MVFKTFISTIVASLAKIDVSSCGDISKESLVDNLHTSVAMGLAAPAATLACSNTGTS